MPTRAGAVTSRYFGETDRTLAEVRLVQQEFAREDLAGGNAEAERFRAFRCARECVYVVPGDLPGFSGREGAEPVEDREESLVIAADARRVLRGGSFLTSSSWCGRVSRRLGAVGAGIFLGFRLARTMP